MPKSVSNRTLVSDYLTPLICAAAGADWDCSYLTGAEIAELYDPAMMPIIPEDTYVVATAPNGARYYINVSMDSGMAMTYDVVKLLMYKV